MDIKNKILNFSLPILNNLNLNIVDVRVLGAKFLTIQILLEKKDNTLINISECALFSKKLSFILDENDFMDKAYNLEVSSAGIDRPLINKEDFIKYAKKDVIIKTNVLIDNKKIFKGILLGLHNNNIQVKIEDEIVNLDFSVVDKANLDIMKNYNINGD